MATGLILDTECNDMQSPGDFPIDKPARRSYVMEDLGEVRHNLNIKKWIMDQVEIKLCLNKEELFKDLREKDCAIQKLKEELEGLKVNKELTLSKVSNLPKASKSVAAYKKINENDKPSEKTNSVTLKRAIKIDDKVINLPITKTRTITTAGRIPTGTKVNNENLKGLNREAGGSKVIQRSKTFRGEFTNGKETSGRNFAYKNVKTIDKKYVASTKKVSASSFQDSNSEQHSMSYTNSKQAENVLLADSEIAANLKRLTEEHSKLQAEYARVRTLLIEANTKCASGMTSPIPPDVSYEPTDEMATNVDGDKQQASNESLDVEFNDHGREGFRKEVLRLKEELLAAQHQGRILSDSKSQLEQDLIERDNVIVQFAKQIEQMILQHNEIISEKEFSISKLTQSVASLQEKILELECEFNETKEFLQEENNTLTEALRDSEEKSWQYCSDMEKVCYQLETKDKHCDVLSKMVEQAQEQLLDLQSQLSKSKDNAQQVIIKQGSELNEVSCAVRELHEVILTIKDTLLEDASKFGIEIDSPDRNAKLRRSNDGRRLVQAILEAAKNTKDSETTKIVDMENKYTDECQSQSLHISEHAGPNRPSNIKEVHESVVTLGKMSRRFTKFIISLVDEANEEKNTLESELRLARVRSEELQKEVEESCRKRWSIEEKNTEITRDLSETRVSLKDARDSLREMWTAANEKASWLIENKKLREDLALQRNLFCELEADRNLLFEELKEIKCNDAESAKSHLNGNKDASDIKCDQLSLKQQLGNMQRQILNKEEEFQDAKKKHDKILQVANKNLHVAETEVHKLDKIIDHVLQVLLNSHDLEIHPVLQQLWKDLDGPGYLATKFDETATIV